MEINYEEILTEWCYRLPKGFPTIVDGKFGDDEEIIILNEILQEIGLKPLISTETNHIREAATEGAAFEEVIIAAWNNTKAPATHKISKDAGKKIVNELKRLGIKGEAASKLPTKGVEVTKEWSRFWEPESVPSATKTPKTDILIGNNRISIKMGAAQLMSGGQNESKATFYAALGSMKKTQDIVLKQIMQKLDLLTKGAVAKGSVESELKKGRDKFLSKANQVNNDVKVLLRTAFEQNPQFRLAFVREAMTGGTKFGTNSPAYAEYVLSSDSTGDKVHLFNATDASFLKKVANATDVTVRFKSTSVKRGQQKTGQYRYWTVVALGVKKLQEEFSKYEGQLLTEAILTNIYDKIKNYVRRVFAKIYDWLVSSIKNVIEFFDFEPQVDFNNEINFSNL